MIINAAMQEFVRNGFEKASTNEIVKIANISKGSLFNYFNSKKNLYAYLIEHSVEVINQIYDETDLSETDIFIRIEKIGFQKLQIQKRFPLVFDFLASSLQEDSTMVKDIIELKIDSIYEQGIAKMYENIDYSKFRDDIDVEKAIEILNWTIFGFGEKSLKQITSFENMHDFGDKYFAEWRLYSDLLKGCFYK